MTFCMLVCFLHESCILGASAPYRMGLVGIDGLDSSTYPFIVPRIQHYHVLNSVSCLPPVVKSTTSSEVRHRMRPYATLILNWNSSWELEVAMLKAKK